jgi:hypothetical protein
VLADASQDAKAVKAATAYLTAQTAGSMTAPAKGENDALAAALDNLADITA